jgi:tetratricopeptide (TPR) repeat protein
VTSDLIALRTLVEGVHRERGLLQPGSDVGAAIRTATRLLDRSDAARSRAILVITDGEDHGASLADAVESARRSGIRLYTAGVGTAEGAPVLDPDPITGQPVVRVGPDGEPVITRLYPDALQRLATQGGGHYVELDNTDLASLTAEFDSLAATTFDSEESTQKLERFQIFAAVALLFADIELLLIAIPRRASAKASRLAKLWPAAASSIFIAALCTTSVADINQDANERFALGQHEEALDLYRTAQSRDNAPELSNNAANALYRLGQFDAAVEEALKARGRSGDDSVEDSQIEYGIGNHYVAAGNLLAAIEAYKRALLANPDDRDAKHNLEVAIKRLTPTPTATPPAFEVTPTPGGLQPGEPNPDSQEATPGEAGEQPGTPAPGEEPQDTSELSREEIQRLLEEALAGIEREFTPEEAERILDLLHEENRRSVEDSAGAIGGGERPDY